MGNSHSKDVQIGSYDTDANEWRGALIYEYFYRDQGDILETELTVVLILLRWRRMSGFARSIQGTESMATTTRIL